MSVGNETKVYRPNKVAAAVIILVFGGVGISLIIAMWDMLVTILMLVLTIPFVLVIPFACAKRVEIDENFLRYYSYYKEKKVLLRTITNVKVDLKVAENAFDSAIHIYTSSQDDPELEIDVSGFSKKRIDDIMDTLKSKIGASVPIIKHPTKEV